MHMKYSNPYSCPWLEWKWSILKCMHMKYSNPYSCPWLEWKWSILKCMHMKYSNPYICPRIEWKWSILKCMHMKYSNPYSCPRIEWKWSILKCMHMKYSNPCSCPSTKCYHFRMCLNVFLNKISFLFIFINLWANNVLMTLCKRHVLLLLPRNLNSIFYYASTLVTLYMRLIHIWEV